MFPIFDAIQVSVPRSFPRFLSGIGLGILLAMAEPVHSSGAPVDLRPAVTPPPKWVQPLFFERLPAIFKPQPGDDQHWLLWERQINVEENVTFCHAVRQVFTFAGVQRGANLAIEFDPDYQSLTVHWVRIWRGTNFVNRLDAEKIRLIQQERDLDKYLFHGEQSAVLVLEDVRAGDIIDYAYSIQGANPVLHQKFFGALPVQLSEPVERLCLRLLWPTQRRLFVRNHGTTVKPTASVRDSFTEYFWDSRHVPARHVEDSLPDWYDPDAWVQLSECSTWGEVNQWAVQLFQNSGQLSQELTEKITEWRQIKDRGDQVLAVLRFVQDEVRYFGIESGAGSHQPSTPSLVFGRRFGDCKDKALLFTAVMRALGTEAWPVLVNTRVGRGIEQWQPSPLAFDHVIAQVRFNGKTYWLDPTATGQRGPLALRDPPEFERGLIVHPNTSGLATIPSASPPPATLVTEYIQLRGKLAPADLRVVTMAQGAEAARLRVLFATQKRDDLEKSYLHFYSTVYPDIKQSSPIKIADDEQKNRIEITENYTIDKMWTWSDADARYHCRFYPLTISGLLKRPVEKVRKMPLAVEFPEHYIVRTEVVLPEWWPGDVRNRVVNNPAFFFRMNLVNDGTKLLIEHEYRALKSSVSPEAAVRFIQDLNNVSDSLGYGLAWR